jgi:UDP-2,4-diacetamido-2,4,6-trideoxy-beta-L-altropyranose hydrolase
MRSLTLARALQARGATCGFIGPLPAGAILRTFAPDMEWLGQDEEAPQALAAGAALLRDFDLVVLDHYGLDAAMQRLAATGRPCVVIDDLANRPLIADMVVDSGPDRIAEDYARLVPRGCRLLLGPAYAPVRPEFAALRDLALFLHMGEAPVERILVSMGLGDLNGITARVLSLLTPMANGLWIDAVLGAGAPSLSSCRALALAYPNLVLHIDTPDMARLTAGADMAIGGAGSSCWERCTVGLPTLQLILADNQRPAARALEAAGAILALDADDTAFSGGFAGAFEEDVHRLITDDRLRAGMAIAAAQVCDGLGADRTAEAVLTLFKPRG